MSDESIAVGDCGTRSGNGNGCSSEIAPLFVFVPPLLFALFILPDSATEPQWYRFFVRVVRVVFVDVNLSKMLNVS